MSATQENAPSCRWVPVTNADGRERMEMRWSAPTQAGVAPHAA